MPPGVKFPGEEIVRAALALVREQGRYAPCPRRAFLRTRVLNALSEFELEPDYKTQCIIFRIPVLAAAYAAYLLRRLPPLTSGESCVRMEKTPRGI